MRIVLVFFLIAITLSSCSVSKRIQFSDEISYSENESNFYLDYLKLNAHSVVKNSETIVEVLNTTETNLIVKEAITIYEKENKEVGNLIIPYSSLTEIEFIKANIIDRNGEIIKSFTQKDAQDYSSYDGFSFFSDNRVKVLELHHNSFPYTIETEFKKRFKGGLFLPSWYPQMVGQAVEKASIKVIDHTKGVRYYSRNIEREPVFLDSSVTNTFFWKLESLIPKKSQVYGPPVQEILPSILLSPSKFEIEGTTGNASTWKEFGKWYYSLGEGTRKLNEDAKKEIDTIIKEIDNETEKVEVLYNYLQNKTRYVSIQLGIGGWKPFSADYVFSNEYGDCKALTNFMQAILEYVGISSNPVLISSGTFESPMITGFPSNQFNHVILRVELDNGEIIWLECTSKYYPPDHIGSGNESKNALMITMNGGKIIETPSSSFRENISSSLTHIKLNENGSAQTNTKIINKGIEQEFLLNTLRPISENARVDWLERRINKSNYTLINTNFSEIENNSKGLTYSYETSVDNFATISGSRIFVPLKTANSWNFNPKLEKNRSQDIWLSHEFAERDTVFYEFSENYEIEATPKSGSVEENFGTYKIDYFFNEKGVLEVQRELIISQKRLKAEEYDRFRTFFTNVTNFDNAELVLVKKK